MKLNFIKNKLSKLSFKDNPGFTLIEIMVATVISMLIISSVYAAFRTSLNAYERNQTRIIMLQMCRMALDKMAKDFSNLYYASGDEELTIMVEDYADNETSMDNDIVSFVTIVNPKLDKYLESLESGDLQKNTSSNASSNTSNETTSDEETENPLPSDLSRVIYFIGQNPEMEGVQSLMRIETTDLDTQNLEDMLSELQSNSMSEDMQETLRISVLVDNVSGFNVRYFDGEEWVDTWDMEEEGTLPKAVEITLTISDAKEKQKPITQAVVVYLPFSDSQQEDTQDQQTGGQNQSGNPMSNQ